MANEIQHVHDLSGRNLYAVIRTRTGTHWRFGTTNNFEARTVANWAEYGLALTETPAGGSMYVGTFPAISGNMVAGWYRLDVYERPSTAAITDLLCATYFGYWDGSTFTVSGALVEEYATGKVPLQPTTAGRTLDVDANNRAPVTLSSDDVTGNIATEVKSYAIGLDPKTIIESPGGLLSLAATANQLDAAIWAQTRFRMSIPERIERPESGTTTYTFGISTYDRNGALADCTGTPTVTAQDVVGTAVTLGSVAKVAGKTGLYEFTLAVAHDAPVPLYIRFAGTGTQAGDTIGMTDYCLIVDDLSPDFTETDRTALGAIQTRTELALPAASPGGQDGLPICDQPMGPYYVARVLSYLDSEGGNIPSAYDIVQAMHSDGMISGAAENVADIVADLAAIAARLSAIGSGRPRVVSPIDETADLLTIIRGDDYAVETWPLGIDFEDPGDWPNLYAATFTLTIRDKTDTAGTGTPLLTCAGELVDMGGTQHVRFRPTAAQTGALAPSGTTPDKIFDAQATIGGKIRTLAIGQCSVVADVTR